MHLLLQLPCEVIPRNPSNQKGESLYALISRIFLKRHAYDLCFMLICKLYYDESFENENGMYIYIFPWKDKKEK